MKNIVAKLSSLPSWTHYIMTKHQLIALSSCEWRTCSRSLHGNRIRGSNS